MFDDLFRDGWRIACDGGIGDNPRMVRCRALVVSVTFGLLSLAATAGGAQVIGLREGESARETAELFASVYPGFDEDGDATPAFAVTRIADARTGLPIPGATMSMTVERTIPYPPTWPAVRVAVADADGWVRMRVDDIEFYDWLLFEAKGYGPKMEMAEFPPDDVTLRPGTDVPIRVVDHLGRPAAAARVGVYVGCGHTQDVRSAVTNEEGRAVIPSIDSTAASLFIQGAGLEATVHELWQYSPGDPELVYVVGPGDRFEGRILRDDGSPAANVLVGARNWNHGPWTTTDAGGFFELEGVHPGSEVLIVEDEWSFDAHTSVYLAPGSPATLRLPPAVEPERDDDDGWRQIPVVIEPRAGWPHALPVTVRACRHGDGLTAVSDVDAGGAPIWLRPGKYTVRTDDSSGYLAPAEVEIDVTADSPAEIRLAPVRRPTFRLVDPAADGVASRFFLVAPGIEIPLNLNAGSVRDVRVPWPEDGPVRIRVERGDWDYAPPRFIDVPTLPLEPVDVSVRWPAGRGGPPPDDLPSEAARRVQVLLGDGRPAVQATMSSLRPLNYDYDQRHDEPAPGGFLTQACELEPGDWVRIENYDLHREWRPMHAHLEGAPPWRLQWPDTGVRFLMTDTQEEYTRQGFEVRLQGTVWRRWYQEDDSIEIVGIPPGPQEFIVSADGRVTMTIRLNIRPKEHRTVSVRLRTAP